jgi:hypothetical protein
VTASYDYSIAKRSPRSTVPFDLAHREMRLVVACADADEPDRHTRLIFVRFIEPQPLTGEMQVGMAFTVVPLAA